MNTPDQMQAIQAMLQQGVTGGDSAPAPVPVTIQVAPIDLSALIKVLTIEGTAVQANLEQILLKTAQGDFVVTAQQSGGGGSNTGQNSGQNSGNPAQDFISQLPARATLQIKTTPAGPEAMLVLDSKNIRPSEQASQQAQGMNPLAPAQSLVPEVPKVGQIHQALVLPATLFPIHEWQATQAVPIAPAPVVQVKETPESLEKAAQKLINSGSAQAVSSALLRSLPPTLQSALTPLLQKLAVTPPPVETQGAAPSLATQQAAPVRPVTTATSTTNDPAPSTTTVKVISVTPQAAQQASVKSDAPVTLTAPDKPPVKTVNATVVANTPSGQPVVQLEGDDNAVVLAVKSSRPWPVGTQMQLEIGRSAEHVTLHESGLAEPKKWETLKHLMEPTTQQNPHIAQVMQDFARLRLPQANMQQMPGALLFLFNAMQKGNNQNWLGKDAEEKLKQIAAKELLGQLQDEFQASKLMGHDAVNGEWRGFMVPFMDQDKMQAFRFFVHQDPFQKNKTKKDADWARRFLIEVNLSRIGAVQVEGLVHKKKLDIVVRTDNPLDKKLQDELNLRFTQTMDEINYAGILLFRSARNGWIDIKEQQNRHVSTAV